MKKLIFKNELLNNGKWESNNFANHKWQLLSISIVDKNGIEINQIIKLQDYLTTEEKEAKIDKANQKMLDSYLELKNNNLHLYK